MQKALNVSVGSKLNTDSVLDDAAISDMYPASDSGDSDADTFEASDDSDDDELYHASDSEEEGST